MWESLPVKVAPIFRLYIKIEVLHTDYYFFVWYVLNYYTYSFAVIYSLLKFQELKEDSDTNICFN